MAPRANRFNHLPTGEDPGIIARRIVQYRAVLIQYTAWATVLVTVPAARLASVEALAADGPKAGKPKSFQSQTV